MFSAKTIQIVEIQKYTTKKSAQNLAFAEIRFPAAARKPSVRAAKRLQIILHEILHFSKKVCQISPKRVFPI